MQKLTGNLARLRISADERAVNRSARQKFPVREQSPQQNWQDPQKPQKHQKNIANLPKGDTLPIGTKNVP